MQQSADKTHAPVILHLLHGTWSPGAAWTQPGSELRRSLEREFRDSVQIDVIRWTGRNRDADRNSAAEQVIPKLRQQNGVHFLVSHSHGGNVAVYAALDPDLRREGRVAGVICMNTPFITVIRRDYTTRLALLTTLAVVAPFMWVMGGFTEGS